MNHLVFVEWADSFGAAHGWWATDDAKKMRPAHTVSVGWIVKQDKQCITLAPHLGFGNGDGDITQMAGVISIPVAAVLRTVRLKEPKITRKR
jgi:hypothetical protein